MKGTPKTMLSLVFALVMMTVVQAQAANSAPTDGTSQGDQEAEMQRLAKMLQNPVAKLISVPIQSNWDFGIGPANATFIQPALGYS